jgi:hypothetical protein
MNFLPYSKHTVWIAETSWLMLFWEAPTDYCASYTKHINALCGQNAKLFNVKAGDT